MFISLRRVFDAPVHGSRRGTAAPSARAGTISTDRGSLHTPAFMPVGRRATVKGVWPDQLREWGTAASSATPITSICAPATSRDPHSGRAPPVHGWDRLILTDSGGFQVFSLSALRKGVRRGGYVPFPSRRVGAHAYPELAVTVQEALGSDVRMALDECVESTRRARKRSKRPVRKGTTVVGDPLTSRRGPSRAAACSDRPGRDVPGPAATQCRGDLRPPVPGIRHRRGERRGGEGTPARYRGRDGADASRFHAAAT